MIRVVNVTSTVVARLGTVSDLSYAWEIINDYIGSPWTRAEGPAGSSAACNFLKLVSILDVPLARILASESPDFESVADYYSENLLS